VRTSGFHLGHERRQRRFLIPVVIHATQPRRGRLLVRPRTWAGWGLRGTLALRAGLRLRVSPGLRRLGPPHRLRLRLRLRLSRSLRLAPALPLSPALWMTLGLRMSPAPGIGLVHRLARAGHAATGWCAPALAVTSRQIPGHDPCNPPDDSTDTFV
jgi:hypothetical protein